MRLSQLLDRTVVTEAGRTVGRVHDIRGDLAGQCLAVTGLVVGPLGLLERYGIRIEGSGGPGEAKWHGHEVIPWERVLRVGAQIVVRD